jgi:hypothetical protein
LVCRHEPFSFAVIPYSMIVPQLGRFCTGGAALSCSL